MVKELRRKGMTLQLLWEEYLRAHPDGYQNSQFCHHFHLVPARAIFLLPGRSRRESVYGH